ncbi:MAG: response regulator [Desulfatiglandaceae bacterium]|jgi:PAS domain S-box-containing protein
MNPKILIVDDEPEILENLETILSDEGYEVVKASSGNEALANFEAGSFGLVITDMKMPGLNGLEVLRRLKQIDKDVEVILLTGHGTMENAIQALRDDGAYDYLRKPLEDIEELLICVGNALERRRFRIENEKLVTELRESERKFRAIFDQTFQFIGIMTIDGTLIEVNRTALDFSGIEEKDALGKPFWETVWSTHSAELEERSKRAISKAADGHLVRFEAFHPAIDGGIHYFDVSIKPVKDEAGNVYSLILESHDITERKQAEQQREKTIVKLQDALAEVKTLRGFFPICSYCKKIRDDKGYWNQIESYIQKHSDAEFSHGICPECAEKYYPDMDLYEEDAK